MSPSFLQPGAQSQSQSDFGKPRRSVASPPCTNDSYTLIQRQSNRFIAFSCAHKGKKMTAHTCLQEMVLSLSSHKCETCTLVSFTGDCGQILLPLSKGGGGLFPLCWAKLAAVVSYLPNERGKYILMNPTAKKRKKSLHYITFYNPQSSFIVFLNHRHVFKPSNIK